MTRPFPVVKPPPLAEQHGQTYPSLVELMRRLRSPAGGCPWDRKQTPETLRRYLLEEAGEVADAIDEGDWSGLREELGDLMFQVVFLAELAAEEARFGHDDEVYGIVDKLVGRHPHVFGSDDEIEAGDVPAQWERIKTEERAAKGLPPRGVLGDVPRGLPALSRAHRLGSKAAKVGFDWPDKSGPRTKITEELAEVEDAIERGETDDVESEIGDLLFAVVNWARHLGVDPERALQRTNRRFIRRFEYVEREVGRENTTIKSASLERLDQLWEAAKRHESETQM